MHFRLVAGAVSNQPHCNSQAGHVAYPVRSTGAAPFMHRLLRVTDVQLILRQFDFEAVAKRRGSPPRRSPPRVERLPRRPPLFRVAVSTRSDSRFASARLCVLMLSWPNLWPA